MYFTSKNFSPFLIVMMSFLFLSIFSVAQEEEELSDEACMLCHADLEEELDDGSIRNLIIKYDQYMKSSHGEYEMACIDCHSDIKELPHEEKLARVNCAECHEDESEIHKKSIHAISFLDEKTSRTVDCAACHTMHNILSAENPLSSTHHHNLANACIQCHEDQTLIDKHDEMPSIESIECYVMSVHGYKNENDPESKAATCNDCHGFHDIQKKDHVDSKINRANVVKTCGACHEKEQTAFYESVHGKLGKEQNPDVPVCTDCHGEHQIMSPENRLSTVNRINISETCAKCHEDPAITEKYEIPISTPSKFYNESIHGVSLMMESNGDAAACHDCHGHHSILGGHDPKSKVNRANIPETCGSCHMHEGIAKDYNESIHGKAFQSGVSESPVCTDCHGEHTILSHLDKNSPVYPTRLAKEVCGRCHDSLVVNRKYGLPTQQVSTYNESYHGLASRLGDVKVANCASCHGVHNILPSTDPNSMIHPDNLQHTCGECHPGASTDFVKGIVHVSQDHNVIYWIRRIYLVLIFGTIGGMLLHNFIIMLRHLRDKYRKQKDSSYVVRFPTFALMQHFLLATSFIVLVITGFSLSYPDTIFTEWMQNIVGWGEEGRAIVHRSAGTCLIFVFILHIITMIFSKRGRQEVIAFWPRWQDVKDIFLNMGYHLGWTKKHPRFDRYDYTEKLEYWALIWGTMVMIVSGFIMWFPVKFVAMSGLGKVWIDAATVIHFYEAWLATLAILFWHFFFVMMHPHEYPLSLTFMTGKLAVDEMKERHPRELEKLEGEGKVIKLNK